MAVYGKEQYGSVMGDLQNSSEQIDLGQEAYPSAWVTLPPWSVSVVRFQ
jgi:hypothetical protein